MSTHRWQVIEQPPVAKPLCYHYLRRRNQQVITTGGCGHRQPSNFCAVLVAITQTAHRMHTTGRLLTPPVATAAVLLAPHYLPPKTAEIAALAVGHRRQQLRIGGFIAQTADHGWYTTGEPPVAGNRLTVLVAYLRRRKR
jgi:hypothetical protein